MPNSLDRGLQAGHSVRPDLGINCLQRLPELTTKDVTGR